MLMENSDIVQHAGGSSACRMPLEVHAYTEFCINCLHIEQP